MSYPVFHLSLALFVFSGSSNSLSDLVLLLFSCSLSLYFFSLFFHPMFFSSIFSLFLRLCISFAWEVNSVRWIHSRGTWTVPAEFHFGTVHIVTPDIATALKIILIMKKRTDIWHLVLLGKMSCLRSRHLVLWSLRTLTGQQIFYGTGLVT